MSSSELGEVGLDVQPPIDPTNCSDVEEVKEDVEELFDVWDLLEGMGEKSAEEEESPLDTSTTASRADIDADATLSTNGVITDDDHPNIDVVDPNHSGVPSVNNDILSTPSTDDTIPAQSAHLPQFVEPINESLVSIESLYTGARIPDELLNDITLNKAIAEALPPTYNFEVHKIIWRVIDLMISTIS